MSTVRATVPIVLTSAVGGVITSATRDVSLSASRTASTHVQDHVSVSL